MDVTHSRAIVYGLAGAAAVLGCVAVAMKAADASHPVPDIVLTTLSGTSFVGAGVFANRRAPANPSGLLMVFVGFALFAEDLQLSRDPAVFTVGLLVAHASTPLVVHLVLAFPDGRLTGRPAIALVSASYAAAFGVSGAGIPFVDWAARVPGKPENLLLIVDAPAISSVLHRTLDLAGVLIGVGILIVLVARLRTGRAESRQPLALVLVVALAGAACSAVAGALGSDHAAYPVMITAYKVAFCLWPLTFALGVVRSSARAAGIADLLVALRDGGDLRELLARTLRDQSLRLGDWDAGRPISAIMGRDTTWDDQRIIEAAGTVAGLVTEHRRLVDESRARQAESRRTRVRLVELADAERRRVERDLHDGAQQRLVIVALGLRLAQQRLDPDAEPELAELLAASAEGLDAAMVELRELARGIHPAVLTQAGLVAAVSALIERTPLRVNLTTPALPRFPRPVEATAYFVITEAITNALKHARATALKIDLTIHNKQLVVTVRDNGIGCDTQVNGTGLPGLADRVRALDGELTVHSKPGTGTTVRVAIPLGEPSCPN